MFILPYFLRSLRSYGWAAALSRHPLILDAIRPYVCRRLGTARLAPGRTRSHTQWRQAFQEQEEPLLRARGPDEPGLVKGGLCDTRAAGVTREAASANGAMGHLSLEGAAPTYNDLADATVREAERLAAGQAQAGLWKLLPQGKAQATIDLPSTVVARSIYLFSHHLQSSKSRLIFKVCFRCFNCFRCFGTFA